MEQNSLFGTDPVLPEGMVYETEVLTPGEEGALLEHITTLAFEEARYKEWHARRRIVSYGGRYDFSINKLLPADPLPGFLLPLRRRIAAWSAIPAEEFVQALISEYRPGTPLGWHRDVPQFASIVGISLGGAARMRMRPYPPHKGRDPAALVLDLQPRSAYLLRGAARSQWQHAISPAREHRYSITFRTLAR
jgi:alkylated DNA repair dioxygenase AlkB